MFWSLTKGHCILKKMTVESTFMVLSVSSDAYKSVITFYQGREVVDRIYENVKSSLYLVD